MKKIFFILGLFLLLIPFKVTAATTIWDDSYYVTAQGNGTSTSFNGGNGTFSNQSMWANRYYVASRKNGVSIPNANLAIVTFTIESTGTDFSISSATLSATSDTNCYFSVNSFVENNDSPSRYVKSVSAYCPYEYGSFTRNLDQWFFYILTTDHHPYSFKLDSFVYINDDSLISNLLKEQKDWLIENNNTLLEINKTLKNMGFDTSGIINNQNQNQQQTNDRLDSINENQQQTNEKLDQTNQQLGDLNNNITNSEVSDANSSANEFFSGFESNDYGLTSIVTAPLNFIKSITSSTCTPLGFQAPFVNQRVELPCMKAIYEEHFGSFLTLYQTITFGIVAYWVCINTLATVRGFKDPDSDRIEVLDL